MSANLQAAATPVQDAEVNPIRVMVVDDSVVVRGLVSRWLNADSEIEVLSTQRNGALAVAEMPRSMPDVVVLDIEMPEMDGMTALPQLLKIKPDCRVIMASTLTLRNAEISLKALALGAADYVAKPETNSGVTTSGDFQRELLEKVRALGASARTRPAARARVIAPVSSPNTAPGAVARAPVPAPAAKVSADFTLRQYTRSVPKILVIGSSTGGPQALLELTKSIAPAIDGVPVVITQHMPPTFTSILAGHIMNACGRPCAEAKHNEVLKPGHIYVAPGGKHLRIGKNGADICALLDDGPAVNFCKPAVDPMFESVVEHFGRAVLATVLTGMGADGREGARAIADAGGNVIAQDEETSVVWGMPGAAANAGVCCDVLPLKDIGPRIARALKGQP